MYHHVKNEIIIFFFIMGFRIKSWINFALLFLKVIVNFKCTKQETDTEALHFFTISIFRIDKNNVILFGVFKSNVMTSSSYCQL